MGWVYTSPLVAPLNPQTGEMGIVMERSEKEAAEGVTCITGIDNVTCANARLYLADANLRSCQPEGPQNGDSHVFRLGGTVITTNLAGTQYWRLCVQLHPTQPFGDSGVGPAPAPHRRSV